MATTMHWLPNFSAALAHEIAIGDGGGIDRHLVGAGQQQLADVVQSRARRRPPSSGMKQASAVRLTTSKMMPRFSWRRGDVEEAQFVGARRVIGLGGFDRIAGIAQVDEIDALDDAAVLDIETGNEAGLQHQRPRG